MLHDQYPGSSLAGLTQILLPAPSAAWTRLNAGFPKITLRLNVAQKPYKIRPLGPKALKRTRLSLMARVFLGLFLKVFADNEADSLAKIPI